MSTSRSTFVAVALAALSLATAIRLPPLSAPPTAARNFPPRLQLFPDSTTEDASLKAAGAARQPIAAAAAQGDRGAQIAQLLSDLVELASEPERREARLEEATPLLLAPIFSDAQEPDSIFAAGEAPEAKLETYRRELALRIAKARSPDVAAALVAMADHVVARAADELQRRSGAPAAAVEAPEPIEGLAQQQACFDALCAEHGVFSAVRLDVPPGGASYDGERGLFTTRAVAAGEPLLAVRWSLCLQDAVLSGDAPMLTPWEAPLLPARDTRLALALLRALPGGEAVYGGAELPPPPRGGAVPSVINAMEAIDAAEASEERLMLWRRWARLLPPPAATTHPVALPEALLDELHHPQLAQAARHQKRRIASLVPRVNDAIGLADGGDADADWLARWAVAMTSSRPFTMRNLAADGAADGDGDADADDGNADADGAADGEAPPELLAAFVPFIDMANHDAEPNCVIEGRADAGGETYGVVGLVASRDMEAGEEATISYGATMSNAFMFANFGFAPPPGTPSNANDRLPFPSELAPFSGDALRATLRTHSGRWADDAALLQAALLSLPLTRDARSADDDAAATRAAVDWLRETAAAEFTTSLQRDEELLRLHAKGLLDGSPAAGGAAATGDDRWVVALHYRIQRKRLWRLAEEVLTTHLDELGKDDAAPAA